MKPCILVVDILKMCIRMFAPEKMIFDKITAFSTLDNFEVSLQRRVAGLCKQLLPEFSSNQFKTFYRCYKHIEDTHVTFSR